MKNTVVKLVALSMIVGGGYVVYSELPTNDIAVGTVTVDVDPETLNSAPVIAAPAVEPSISTSPTPVINNVVEPKLGAVFADLTIPAINKKLKVKHGVRVKDIENNPGHYPGTAMPGEIGNFAVAGHRIRNIFHDVHELEAGDIAYVDVNGKRYTYRFYKSYIVAPNAWEVVSNDVAPGKAILTITTCLLKKDGGNSKRQVLHFALVR